MLTIKLDDVDVKHDNDTYFASETFSPDIISKYKDLILRVEGLQDGDVIHSKFDSNLELQTQLLSTGCKTVLNVKEHPQVAFDIIEAGDNAVYEILKTDGTIYTNNMMQLAGFEDLEDIEVKVSKGGVNTINRLWEVLNSYGNDS